MRALIQRVREARVEVDGACVGEIGQGLLALVGVQPEDDAASVQRLLQRLLNYRVFSDADGKMNLNVKQANGSILIVSQFTLAADTKKGLRPSFSNGALPQQAEQLYDYFSRLCRAQINTANGVFAADMQVGLINDGPVTFWLQV